MLRKVIITFVVVLFVFLGILKQRGFFEKSNIEFNSKNVLHFLKTNTKILTNNILKLFKSKKDSSFSLLGRKMQLLAFLPSFFSNFNNQDWQEFWSIVYGVEEDNAGYMRQLLQKDQETIVAHLKFNYPDTFLNFSSEHWAKFFSIIFQEEEYYKLGKSIEDSLADLEESKSLKNSFFKEITNQVDRVFSNFFKKRK